jgi:ketosteroid isomerase-like protein
MKSCLIRIGCLAFSLLFTIKVTAQPPVAPATAGGDEAIHNELRAMREVLTKAVLAGDIEAQLSRVNDNVVVTWQNNEVVRGKDGLKKFLGEMSNGKERVFQRYKVPPTADDLSIVYGGDAAIAFGSSTPHYKLHGMEFDLENRWTATLVKEGDTWKIAAYHVSGNILDNPVLNLAKQSLYWAGGIGVVVGLVLGALLMWLMKRQSLRSV